MTPRPRWLVASAALALCVAVGASARGQAGGSCPSVDEDINLAVLDYIQLQAMSGLVASHRNPRHFLTHNHSGDMPQVHVIRDDGQWMGVIAVDGADHDDWEDIAMGDDGSVYVGDIGDERGRRARVQIYRFPEPTITGDGLPSPVRDSEVAPTRVRVRGQRMDVRLPGGAVDARALLEHAGELFIVSHERERARVFALGRFRAGRTVTATLRATVPLPGVTGGDVAPDGRVILRTLDRAWLFPPGPSGAAFEAPCPVLLRAERRGEAIAFDATGAHYYTVSEGRSALFRFRLRAPAP